MASSSIARQHLWNRYSTGLNTDVSGNVRSPPIDGSNEASDTGDPGLDSEEGAGQGGTDTGVERQGDNQDGDEAGRPVQLDGRQAKGYYSAPCVFSKMLHSGLYLIKAG